jgi:hypothetical protein
MINPAQYTKVLQGASDEQLMAMLKRPDKIPSQFIVAEINRRQAMRQAAQAEQRKAASMQQQPVMQQAPQQMPPQGQMQQRPAGMRIGGQPLSALARMRPYMQDGRDQTPSMDMSNMDFSGLRQNLPYIPGNNKGLEGLPSARMVLASTNNSSASNQNALSPAEQIAMDDTAMTNIDSGPPTAKQVVDDAYGAFDDDLATTQAGIKSGDDNKVTAPEIDESGIKSTKVKAPDTDPNTDTSALESATKDSVIPTDTGPTQTSLFKEVFEANEADRVSIAKAQEALSANQRKRLEGLQTEFDGVTQAMEDLAKVYDKNSTTPENRFFKAMTDMGLDLLASPEANFMQALGTAGKKGVATWETLNKEAKDNVLKKYTATVNLAKTRADLTGRIVDAANAIDAGDVNALNTILSGRMEDRQGIISAGAQDKDFSLKGTGLELTERGQNIDAAGTIAKIAQGDSQIKSGEAIAGSNIAARQAEGDANRGTQVATTEATLENRTDIANQADVRVGEGNQIKIQGLELQSLNSYLSNQNEQERIRIAEITANKDPASVAYLDRIIGMKDELGLDDQDIKNFILGTGKGSDSYNRTLEATARALAVKDIDRQTPIPGVEPADGERYSSAQYLAYHRGLLGLTGGDAADADPLGLN